MRTLTVKYTETQVYEIEQEITLTEAQFKAFEKRDGKLPREIMDDLGSACGDSCFSHVEKQWIDEYKVINKF